MARQGARARGLDQSITIALPRIGSAHMVSLDALSPQRQLRGGAVSKRTIWARARRPETALAVVLGSGHHLAARGRGSHGQPKANPTRAGTNCSVACPPGRRESRRRSFRLRSFGTKPIAPQTPEKALLERLRGFGGVTVPGDSGKRPRSSTGESP